MILKQPFVIDVSHWKTIPDFSLVFPRPALVLTKATECYPGTPFNNTTDPTFAPYFADLKVNGIPRGAFHFFRNAYDTTKQANHFVETIRPHVTDADILVMDVEEDGIKASQMWLWFEIVRARFPRNTLLLYSRKEMLDRVIMTNAEKEYFKQIPTWTAGYPWFPDLFSKVPSGYIPDQSKYGPVWLWQYTDSGRVTGIAGDTDCNLIDPVFYAMISTGGTPIPPPEPNGGSTMQGYKCVRGANVRPLSDMNKISASIKIGDRVWGEASLINGLQRVTIQKIYRSDDTVDEWENCTVAIKDGATVILMTIPDAEPGTPDPEPQPTPDNRTDVFIVEFDESNAVVSMTVNDDRFVPE